MDPSVGHAVTGSSAPASPPSRTARSRAPPGQPVPKMLLEGRRRLPQRLRHPAVRVRRPAGPCARGPRSMPRGRDSSDQDPRRELPPQKSARLTSLFIFFGTLRAVSNAGPSQLTTQRRPRRPPRPPRPGCPPTEPFHDVARPAGSARPRPISWMAEESPPRPGTEGKSAAAQSQPGPPPGPGREFSPRSPTRQALHHASCQAGAAPPAPSRTAPDPSRTAATVVRPARSDRMAASRSPRPCARQPIVGTASVSLLGEGVKHLTPPSPAGPPARAVNES